MKEQLFSGKLQLPSVIIATAWMMPYFFPFEPIPLTSGMYLYPCKILQNSISSSSGNCLIHLYTEAG